MEHDADKRAVNVHSPAVVVDEAQFPEPIQKETDSRTGCAYHLGKGFLTDFRDERHWLGFLTKVSHQQEQPGKAFLAGVEHVIYKVGFHADVPRKKIGEKAFSELREGMIAAIPIFLKAKLPHSPSRKNVQL